MKKKPRELPSYPPELPEARPMPYEANPNGIEGVDAAWPGGSSNLGEILNPWPDPSTYSTEDLPPEARVDVVRAFICEKCGATFETVANLNLHRRTAHRPRT
jgi:hypothetical protein